MFYCDDCAKRYGYPKTVFRSRGPCECCDKSAVCNDMPSSMLPMPKQAGRTPNEKDDEDFDSPDGNVEWEGLK